MPRIRNLKKLVFFKPDRSVRYEHINGLFSEAVNWELIETHLPDMLRIALSIKAGKITPSTILRRLGTASRKNKLYFAFRPRVPSDHCIYPGFARLSPSILPHRV